jgi:hypothetical protein
MTRPPIDLDDSAAVCAALADIPLRVRPGYTDLMVMIAGADRLASTLLLVDDVPDRLAQHERVQSLSRMWRELAAARDGASVAVALCRSGHPDPTGDDLAWHDAIRATATNAGITCTGVFLSTHHGVAQVLPAAA